MSNTEARMNRVIGTVLAALLIVAMASPAGAQTMHRPYATFTFSDDSEAPRPSIMSSAVAQVMEEKGYHHVNASQADLTLLYWAGQTGELLVELQEYGVWVDQTWIESFPIGALVIVMIDTRSHDLVWAGASQLIITAVPSLADVRAAVADVKVDLPSRR